MSGTDGMDGMDGKVALGVRGIVLTAVAVVALVVAYVAGGAGGATPSAAAADGTTDQPSTRTITVSGTGTAHAVPDELSFTVSVDQTRPSLTAALAAGNTDMRRVLAALAQRGVQSKDVQTTDLSMDPVYDYPDKGRPVLRGYEVSQSAAVLVRDLSDGGGAVNAAVTAGGNAVRVDGLQLVVSDPEAAMQKARADAVAQAKARATEYADAAGQELGEVITLHEVGQDSPEEPTYARAAASTADASGDVPIKAGTDDLSVTVQVVWGLD